MNDIVIGLDIGTGSVKAVATDSLGLVVGEVASAPLTTSSPTPGASEQVPAELLAAATDTIARIMRLVPQYRVAAIAAAAQSGSLVPIDATDTPTRVVTWMDTRSAPLIGRWSAEQRATIRHVSGWSTSPGLGLSSIAWMRDHDPSAFTATTRFASVDDLIAHRLTGEWSTNPSNASGMQLMDVATRQWSERLCNFVGVVAEQLSTIVPSGSEIGPIRSEAATAIGLDTAALLIAGGHDQACAAYALGVVEPGAVFLSAGTAWVLTTPAARGDVDSLPDGISLSPHILDRRWSASRHIGALGAATAWALNELGVVPGDAAAILQTHTPAPSDPFFLPALDDPTRVAWGRFVHRRADSTTTALAWAVLESAAFEVRRELETLSIAFGPVASLVAVGRAASPVTCRLIASACNVSVISRDEASWPALGAAQIAASKLGWARPTPDPSRSRSIAPYSPLVEALAARYLEYQCLVEGA